MHITPMELAGKILDMFFIVGEDAIHIVLMGVLECQKQKILAMKNEEEILQYLKGGLMKDIFNTGCIGSILLMEHLLEFYKKNNFKQQ